MGPKKSRKNVRKIEVPTNTPTEFDLGDTTAGIQRRREKREQREGGGRKTTERGEEERGCKEGGNSTDGGGSGWKKDQELKGVKVKWTQRVEARPAHLNPNPGARKDL